MVSGRGKGRSMYSLCLNPPWIPTSTWNVEQLLIIWIKKGTSLSVSVKYNCSGNKSTMLFFLKKKHTKLPKLIKSHKEKYLFLQDIHFVSMCLKGTKLSLLTFPFFYSSWIKRDGMGRILTEVLKSVSGTKLWNSPAFRRQISTLQNCLQQLKIKKSYCHIRLWQQPIFKRNLAFYHLIAIHGLLDSFSE